MYFKSFLSLILEKDPLIFGDKKDFINEGNEKEIINKIFEYYNTKKLNITNELKWHHEKRSLIVEDISYVFKILCINMLKNILSSIYPYILNEKTVQKYFKVLF